jgi:hypothetical protein
MHYCCIQEPHAKQVQELLASQEAVAKERSKLDAMQKELQAKRTEMAAQV